MTDKLSNFITHLFDAISSDPAMPAELKISLLRLQLPVHKLSLTDPYFMSNEKHPARRTLFIARRLSGAAQNDPSLISKIDLVLSALIQSTPNSTNFAQTNQRLLQLLKETASSTPEQKPAQANTTTDTLKQQFNRKIKMCIQGHQIPSSCQHLVLKLWPNALLHLFKTHGDQSPHWANSVTLFCKLLESIQPIISIDQYRHLKDTFMDTVRKNNNTLLRYYQNSAIEPDIKALISYYNNVLGSTHYATEHTADTSMSLLDKISSLPAEIKPGIWCEIYIDEITPARRLRLSLINIETGTLIFVNRKGIKKVEKDAFVFSEELKHGLSRVYNYDALFSKPSSKAEYQKIG
ncbi:hypothetical protein MNBD_GAMMA11-2318 [hydrothermal vent metagenome]|uniref:Uncharacterized protein n=1 Tax=hydrothermal vent metagenome TaxID=652676 RepID=A0A3B0XIP4_9ZZZZ